MTDCLVCVYYRVDGRQRDAAIAAARELQRGVAGTLPAGAVELLLRCDHFVGGGDAQGAASDASTPQQTADPTLMETYRLDARTATADTLSALLARLADGSPQLDTLRRSPRHVEVFRPCAS